MVVQKKHKTLLLTSVYTVNSCPNTKLLFNIFVYVLLALCTETSVCMQGSLVAQSYNLVVPTCNFIADNFEQPADDDSLLNDTCCCNFDRFYHGMKSAREDICFGLVCGCCAGACCLDRRGRIIPLLCCARYYQQNRRLALNQIPDTDYSACSDYAGICCFALCSLAPIVYVVTSVSI